MTTPGDSRFSGWRRLLRIWSKLARVERWLFVFIIAIAGSLAAFFSLADEVVEGDTRAFDERLLLALRNPSDLSDPLGPRWFEELMRDYTALGGSGVLMLVTAAVVGFLVITHKRSAAWAVTVAVVSGTLLSQVLKWGFDRPRPALVPHGAEVYMQSFPSGHAMLSAVVYLTLGALLAQMYAQARVKAYLLTVAVLLTLLVGVSRVYLGVHWPTDVLAGWSLGAAWALACQLVFIWLQRHGDVETGNRNRSH